jgi:hypothetical protein
MASTDVNRARTTKHRKPTCTNLPEPKTSAESHHEESSRNDNDVAEIKNQEIGRKDNHPVDNNSSSTASSQKSGRKENYTEDPGKKCKNRKKTGPACTPTVTRKKLKCTFTNAQGYISKRDDMQCHIEDEAPDIVGIVETWLKSDTGNAEIQIPGYQTTRLDRQNRPRGGILLYTKEGINVQLCEDPALSLYDEALWCELSSQATELNLLLGIVYRTPSSTKEESDCLNQVLRSLGDVNKDIMIIGDFNYRDINWETMQAVSGTAEAFLDVIQDNLWSQHVTKPTREESLLDLVITSNPDVIDETEVVEHLGTSDHNMVVVWDINYLY